MGLIHSPRTVTDGLVLHLDAANVKSYPGSGTTWTDMSGNGNNGTLTNGPTFNTGSLGNIQFDGINDYTIVNRPITSIFSELTLEIVFKTPIAGNSNTGFLLWDHTSGWPMWLGKSQSNQWYWFWNYGSALAKSAQISSTSYVSNSWIHIAVRSYLSNTNRILETNNFAELIINGKNYSTIHRNNDTSSLNYPSGNFYLGRRGFSSINGELGTIVSDYSNLYISNFKIYNRVLNREEIKQNFNALRGRFGL